MPSGRRPFVAGNWKCNGTLAEAHALARQIINVPEAGRIDTAVCPPFTTLHSVAPLLKGSSVWLGAQDLFWEAKGAFTGEVSPAMLVDVGCRYVIIGHSERRTHFGETDANVQRKLVAALASGLMAILCIGETLIEREMNRTFEVLTRQLDGALNGRAETDAAKIVIAYEPVWAIGTGRTATPQQAQEVHAFIRQQLAGRWNSAAASSIRIQYGGSVTAENAAELMRQPDVDGALVGGASLKAESFAAIIKAAAHVKG